MCCTAVPAPRVGLCLHSATAETPRFPLWLRPLISSVPAPVVAAVIHLPAVLLGVRCQLPSHAMSTPTHTPTHTYTHTRAPTHADADSGMSCLEVVVLHPNPPEGLVLALGAMGPTRVVRGSPADPKALQAAGAPSAR